MNDKVQTNHPLVSSSMFKELFELTGQIRVVLALEIFHIDSNIGKQNGLVDVLRLSVNYKKHFSSFAIHLCSFIRPHLDVGFDLGVLHYK